MIICWKQPFFCWNGVGICWNLLESEMAFCKILLESGIHYQKRYMSYYQRIIFFVGIVGMRSNKVEKFNALNTCKL